MSDLEAIAGRDQIRAWGEFTERVYEIRYLDTTPLTGSALGKGAGVMTPGRSGT